MLEIRPYRRNHASVWNPFSEMDALERQMFGSDFFSSRDLAEFKTDITDEGDHFDLKADLPGFKKEDIHLELNGDTLVISAERHSEHEQKDQQGKFVCRERSYGSYSRSFDISGVDAEGIKAAYDDGVLDLTLPKRVPEKPAVKQIVIG